jgi:hypothetical protein
MTYIEPRFDALAFRISDWPEMPTVLGDLVDLGHHRLGALDGGAVGELDRQHQVAGVLLRDETGRSADEFDVG